MNRRVLTSSPFFASVFALAAAWSCADEVGKRPALDKAAAAKISYRSDVWPIFKRHCWGCHSEADAQGGLSMDTVAKMLKGGEGGPMFEAGKPDDSLLIEMIIGDEPEMPRKQPPLSAAKIQTLRQWVLDGARDDSIAEDRGQQVRIPDTYKFAPAVTSVALSPDGNQVAAACRSEVVLIDVSQEEAKVTRRIPTECDLLTHVEFSPDGTMLAAAGGSPARSGEVHFINPKDGSVVMSQRVGHDTLFRGNFAPDGKAIALGGADGAVHVVPLEKDKEIRSFDLHSDWVMDVAWSPDGKLLISGGRDKATKVCSVESGRLLRTVDSSTELISSVAVDQTFAVAAGRARTLIGYELKTALSGIEVTGAGNGARPISKRDQYAKNFESQPGQILDIASSGDRKLIAVAGEYGEVRVYNVETRQRVALISNVPSPIYSVALDFGGSRLALGSKTGLVEVYQLPDGKRVASLTPVPVDVAIAASK